MKKGWLIAIGVAVCLGAAALPFALASNPQVERLMAHRADGDTLTKKETEVLDIDKNGTVNGMDLLLAKRNALFRKDEPLEMVYAPIDEHVKLLGRTAYRDDSKTLWCALSGTGVAFRFSGTRCTLTLIGDSQCTTGEGQAVRYAVYLNDELKSCTQLTTKEQVVTILESDTVQDAEVRLVKLSESAQSAFGIRDITVTATDGIHPVAPLAHSIEFIGDSITCGYGVDNENINGGFQTKTENVTRTYAYQTAAALQADYSMVSFSGFGVISGYTTGTKPNDKQLVPTYYDKLGFSYGTMESNLQPQKLDWTFAKEPELVVLNLGTNDASYTKSDPAKQQDFVAGYVAFLKTVRANNPNAAILCTLGIMGDTLCESMETAAAQYTAETGDKNIATMRFAVQMEADGYAVDWHPTAATHTKAAEKLTAFIKEWQNW